MTQTHAIYASRHLDPASAHAHASAGYDALLEAILRSAFDSLMLPIAIEVSRKKGRAARIDLFDSADAVSAMDFFLEIRRSGRLRSLWAIHGGPRDLTVRRRQIRQRILSDWDGRRNLSAFIARYRLRKWAHAFGGVQTWSGLVRVPPLVEDGRGNAHRRGRSDQLVLERCA